MFSQFISVYLFMFSFVLLDTFIIILLNLLSRIYYQGPWLWEHYLGFHVTCGFVIVIGTYISGIRSQVDFFVCLCFGRFFLLLFIYSSFILLVEVLAMFEGELGIRLCSIKVEISFLSIMLGFIAPGSIPEALQAIQPFNHSPYQGIELQCKQINNQ